MKQVAPALQRLQLRSLLPAAPIGVRVHISSMTSPFLIFYVEPLFFVPGVCGRPVVPVIILAD